MVCIINATFMVADPVYVMEEIVCAATQCVVSGADTRFPATERFPRREEGRHAADDAFIQSQQQPTQEVQRLKRL